MRMMRRRETTELLTVNDAFMNVKSYTDFFCVTLGDALRAISVGERHAYAWTSQPTLCEGKVVSASVQVST